MLGFKAFLISRSKKLLLFMVCTILSWQPCKRKMKRVTQVPAWPPTTKHPDHVWTQFLSASIKSKKLPSRALASFLFLWMPASLVRGFPCAPIKFLAHFLLLWTVKSFPCVLFAPLWHPFCFSDCQIARCLLFITNDWMKGDTVVTINKQLSTCWCCSFQPNYHQQASTLLTCWCCFLQP